MNKLPSQIARYLCLLVCLFLTTACGSQTLAIPEKPAETLSLKDPVVTEEAIATPVVELQEASQEQDQCIVCHTDKQRLIDTGKPETEEAESENEGEG